VAAGLDQRHAPRIVHVDDAWRMPWQHLEQAALRLEVRVHVRVEVEMITRQVGEDGGGERHPVNAT
jgi:hypothetical protein